MANKTPFDAVVVGTGFGGAVAVERLHKAGKSLCVLERGWEYHTNFSREPEPEQWLWQAGRCGLFDVQPGQDVDVVTAAGVGGGSLIYASVHLRAPAQTLDASPWREQGLTQHALAPYYSRVEQHLSLKTVTQAEQQGVELPPKTEHFRAAAAQLGRAAHRVDAPLAINLWHNAESDLAACTYCGQCDMGCNVGAKNTLDQNYLRPFLQAAARRLIDASDAQPSCLLTGSEAIAITGEKGKYRVQFRRYVEVNGRPTWQEDCVEAAEVFVCGGAIHSPALLLRSVDAGLPLSPHVAGKIGKHYSANADTFGLITGSSRTAEVGVGPVITSVLVHNRPLPGGQNAYFLVEDGGISKRLVSLLDTLGGSDTATKRALHQARPQLGKLKHAFRKAAATHTGHRATQAVPLPKAKALDSVQVLLLMGRDLKQGQMRLEQQPGDLARMEIRWDNAANWPLTEEQVAVASDLAAAMGGTFHLTPTQSYAHTAVTVHSQGGCAMGAVVDAYGEVIGAKGLYVLDASIFPGSVGVNPAHTICAVAEHHLDQILLGKLEPAQPTEPAPLTELPVVMQPIAPVTQPVTLTMDEFMHGFGGSPSDGVLARFVREVTPTLVPTAFDVDCDAGRVRGSGCRLWLTLNVGSIAAFLAEPQHRVQVAGTVAVDGLTPPEGVAVRKGTLALLISDEGFYTRHMRYELDFVGHHGKLYRLEGIKTMPDPEHILPNPWRDTTTLKVEVLAHSDRDKVVWRGIARLSPVDFARQLASTQLSGGQSTAEQKLLLARFGAAFFGELWQAYVARFLARAGEPGGLVALSTGFIAQEVWDHMQLPPRIDEARHDLVHWAKSKLALPFAPPPRPHPRIELVERLAVDVPLYPTLAYGAGKVEVADPGTESLRLFVSRYAPAGQKPRGDKLALVAHGAGVSSSNFVLDSLPDHDNFATWLHERGYDVWLVDWRASTKTTMSQFDLDVASAVDYRAALTVLKQAYGKRGLPPVTLVGHCMGANTLLQALMVGAISRDEHNIERAVLSAIGLHFAVPDITRLKVDARVAELMQDAGLGYLTARGDHPGHRILHTLWSAGLQLVHPECNNTACHRMNFMYGSPFRHENLAHATHERLAEEFGYLSAHTFVHISQQVRAGHSQTFDYGAAENCKRYGQVTPLSYLHMTPPSDVELVLFTGEHNQLWLPSGLRDTAKFLKLTGANLRDHKEIRGYAHQDLYWGIHARAEVWDGYLADHL